MCNLLYTIQLRILFITEYSLREMVTIESTREEKMMSTLRVLVLARAKREACRQQNSERHSKSQANPGSQYGLRTESETTY
jgi:hypothetical protein